MDVWMGLYAALWTQGLWEIAKVFLSRSFTRKQNRTVLHVWPLTHCTPEQEECESKIILPRLTVNTKKQILIQYMKNTLLWLHTTGLDNGLARIKW